MKVRNKSKGSELVQFGCIVALVSLAAAVGFGQLGEMTVSVLESYNTFFADNNAAIAQNAADRNSALSAAANIPSPSPSNTTPSSGVIDSANPISVDPVIDPTPPIATTPTPHPPSLPTIPTTPTSSGPSIDMGAYTLSTLPEDYVTFVETSGVAGTTNTLVAAIEEIIAQAEAAGAAGTMDTNLLKELANYGHNIASLESQMETNAQNYLNSPVDNLTSSQFNDLAVKMNEQNYLIGFNQTLNQFNQTMNSKPLSAEEEKLVNSINSLSFEINSLGEYMKNTANSFPLGGSLDVTQVTTNAQKLTDPNASVYTDVRSSLICISGDNVDNGQYCY